MEFNVGTSRFYDIVDYFWYEEGIPGEAYGGFKIPQLITKGLEILRITGYHRRNDNIMYFGGGMPDITVRTKSRFYEEVTHQGDPQTLVDNLMAQIEEGATWIKAAGATPVFCTVCPMDFSLWNNHRFNIGKTNRLIHSHHYSEMQNLHQDTIHLLNNRIIEFNMENEMCTPKLAKFVFQKKGENLPYRLRHSRLKEDGVHPTEDTIGMWVRCMRDIFEMNRMKLYNNPDFREFSPQFDGLEEAPHTSDVESDIDRCSDFSSGSVVSNETVKLSEELANERAIEVNAALASMFYERNPHKFEAFPHD